MILFSIIDALHERLDMPSEYRVTKDAEHIAVRESLEKEWARLMEGILSNNADEFEKLTKLHGDELKCERKEGYIHGYVAGVLAIMEIIAEKESNDKWVRQHLQTK